METEQQTGVTPSRPRASVRRVYENFRPTAEWKQEPEYDILLVYLPGFRRDQIHASAEGRNIIRVRGERQVAGNRWSRFQEDFPVPEYSNMKGIQANFQNAILRITVPRLSATQVGPKGDAKIIQQDIPPQAPSISDTRKQDTKTVQTQGPQMATTEPKPQKGQDEILPKFASTIGGDRQTDGKSTEAPGPQKVAMEPKSQEGQAETPKVLSGSRTEKQTDEKTTKLTSAENAVQQAVKIKKIGETKMKTADSEVPESAKEKTVKEEKNGIEKGKEPVEAEPLVEKTKEKNDGASSSYEQKPEERKQTTKVTTVGHGGGYKQAVKFIKELNEERQLMVNMGVAVLVIVALVAYVSYTFGSGKVQP